MKHSTGTPTQFTAVAGHTRLFRREGGTYYLRAKVPPRLRAIIGKTEIRKSLRTKELKTALPLVKVESLDVDRQIAEAEEKLTGRKVAMPALSEDVLAWLTNKYFIERERRGIDIEDEADGWTEQERHEVANDFKADSMALNTPSEGYDNFQGFADDFLQAEIPHLNIEEGSDAYKKLSSRFRRALTEHYTRLIYRLEGQRPPQNEFVGLDAHSVVPPPPRQQMPFGKFLDEFVDYQEKTHANTTPSAYRLPVRLLRESIGEKTPIHEITKQHVEKACEMMRQVPFNVTQRYKGLPIEKAIEVAKRNKDARTIQPRTAANYYMLITAIFNYAEDEGYIPRNSNPAKSRKLREMFRVKKTSTKRAIFTDAELKTIFNAPLYRGCKNDGHGCSEAGPNVIRRGRFWVPLLGLFQGLRCNEACQLYAQDVKEEKGILYLNIREDLDDETADDKHVKNSASWRKVPVHPELLKIGFKEFVDERRKDASSPRLFPELKLGNKVRRYSHVFSKWFGLFLKRTCGYKPAATFHSFRHHFRSALKSGKVGMEDVEALGGWREDRSSEHIYLHLALADLKEAISRVTYPDLDLSHLYPPELPQKVADPQDQDR